MLKLLEGIRIIDLTKLRAALATCHLADLGADVIKVEWSGAHGDYYRTETPFVHSTKFGLGYLMINRNKRSLGLNLKSDEGREIFRKLISTADAVVDVSKPGTFERLGLGHEVLREIKPDLICCSITGFGLDGPFRDLPSHGFNIDGAAGMLQIDTDPDGAPELAGYSAIGLTVSEGAHFAALAIVSAVVQRDRTGKGQDIEISCWDAGLAMNLRFHAALNFGSASFAAGATGRGGVGPRYNSYGTKDGKAIFFAALERRFWDAFCDVADRPDLLDRGTWDEPMDFALDDPTLRAEIQKTMQEKTLDEWMELFVRAGVPASPIIEPDDLVTNPHTEARRVVVDAPGERYSGARWVAPPVRTATDEFHVRFGPPTLGEHSDELLAELGYGESDRSRLAERGIAGVPIESSLTAAQ